MRDNKPISEINFDVPVSVGTLIKALSTFNEDIPVKIFRHDGLGLDNVSEVSFHFSYDDAGEIHNGPLLIID
jgi:hypothetical protein